MLALTRRTGETIRIGDDVTITIAEIRGNTIRLHIDAPRTVRILREEIFQKVATQNAEAAQNTTVDLADLAGLLQPTLGTSAPARNRHPALRPIPRRVVDMDHAT